MTMPAIAPALSSLFGLDVWLPNDGVLLAVRLALRLGVCVRVSLGVCVRVAVPDGVPERVALSLFDFDGVALALFELLAVGV